MKPSSRDVERFKGRLVKTGDCLLFLSGNSRYGQFGFVDEDTGLRIRIGAHRFAYMLAFGYIPDGMFVMHQCDTPRCCNPSHLSLGTPQDNTNDMLEKGRHPTMLSRARRKAISKRKIDKFFINRQLRRLSSCNSPSTNSNPKDRKP